MPGPTPGRVREVTACSAGRVTILGGGGIAEALIELLQPFECHITVVRSNVHHMDGVDVVLEAEQYADSLPGADLVVLALPLTPDTEELIGRDELALMESHAWLVNVARGGHVVTDDLVEALRDGVIGGAGLEVTDPEPLPDWASAVAARELHHHAPYRHDTRNGPPAAGRTGRGERAALRCR